MAFRCVFGVVEVIAAQLDGGAQRAHPLDLQRVCAARREDGQRPASFAAGVSHALAEIAGGRTHEPARILSKAMQEIVGAAALEAAYRIDRLDLEKNRHTESLAEWFGHELRRVEEDGIDRGGGLADVLDRDR